MFGRFGRADAGMSVSPAEAASLLADGAVMLDVREAAEVRGGYLRWAASGLPTTSRPGGRRHR